VAVVSTPFAIPQPLATTVDTDVLLNWPPWVPTTPFIPPPVKLTAADSRFTFAALLSLTIDVTVVDSDATLLLVMLRPVDSEFTPLCAVLMPVDVEVDSDARLVLVAPRPVDSELRLVEVVVDSELNCP
jgi:hypothetical protein